MEAELLNGCIEWNRKPPRQYPLVYTNFSRPLDTLVVFETASASAPPPVRYAVRQVLDQEYQKNIIVRANAARQARFKAGGADDQEVPLPEQMDSRVKKFQEDKVPEIKRDFFGRVISGGTALKEINGNAEAGGKEWPARKAKIWVTYHEGFSNAVKKPITVEQLLRGL